MFADLLNLYIFGKCRMALNYPKKQPSFIYKRQVLEKPE
jgi:hypothetical protein